MATDNEGNLVQTTFTTTASWQDMTHARVGTRWGWQKLVVEQCYLQPPDQRQKERERYHTKRKKDTNICAEYCW